MPSEPIENCPERQPATPYARTSKNATWPPPLPACARTALCAALANLPNVPWVMFDLCLGSLATAVGDDDQSTTRRGGRAAAADEVARGGAVALPRSMSMPMRKRARLHLLQVGHWAVLTISASGWGSHGPPCVP
eukprot:scaffold1130_cov74-Phaeocystis_antarctica.AAC.9